MSERTMYEAGYEACLEGLTVTEAPTTDPAWADGWHDANIVRFDWEQSCQDHWDSEE